MGAELRQISADEARAFLDATRLNSRTLLDVRQDFEYAEGHLPGALNIPLPQLAERIVELDPVLPTLVYCRAGRRSLAAANILVGQGFREVMSLDGGIYAWEGAQATGPASLGMEAFHTASTVREFLGRAWVMELALEEFYLSLAALAEDAELKGLLLRLGSFELRHRKVIAETCSRSLRCSLEDFEQEAARLPRPAVLEGGVGAEEYLGLSGHPETASQALEVAMAIEAQAMDLYMRRAAAESDQGLRRTLLFLAEEERAHLKVIGAFVDGRGRF